MSSETDDLENVVQLVQPDNEERKLLNIVPTNPKTYQQKRCKHVLEVDEENRTITCTHCGVVVEPFDFILERAINAEHIVTEIETLYTRQKELRSSVANLEREEKNAKARLRSARTATLYAENELKNLEQKANQLSE